MTHHGAECPKCWARKGYERDTKGLRAVLLRVVGMLPLKCHHCYHRFAKHRLLMSGCDPTPPQEIAVETRSTRPSYAALHIAERAA